MKNKITQAVDKSLKEGWRMYKKISSGGLFSNPTYDNRTVYNRKDLLKLNNEGFDLNENIGVLVLNILLDL